MNGAARPSGSAPISDAVYRELVELSNDLLYRFGVDGSIESVSAAVERLTGYRAEEVVGRNVFEILHPESLLVARRHHEAKVAGQEDSSIYEVQLVRKDGTAFWAEVSSRAVRKAGRTMAIQGVIRDASARRRVADELEQERRRYQELFENANDVIYTHDLLGRFTSVNAMAVRTYGYSREEFGQMSIADIVHPDHLARAKEMMALKTQGVADRTPPYELLTRAKDGAHVWVEVSTRLLREAGKPVAVQGIVRDVTARKVAEARLVESEKRYRSLVDGVPIGLFRTLPDGTYLDANPAMANILGVADRAALLRRNANDFYPRAGERREVLDQVPGEGGGRAFEAQARRADGAPIWIRGTIRAVTGPDGAVQWYEGHVEDISQTREAEARIRFVQDMGMRLTQAADFPSALALTLKGVCEAAGWSYAECWVPTPDGSRLVAGEPWFGATPNLGKFHHLSRKMEFGPGEGLCGRVWSDGATAWRPDVALEPAFHRAASALAVGLRTVLVVPVRRDRDTVAVLVFMHSAPRPGDLAWVQMVETVATQLGGVIARRQAEDQLRAQTALLEGQLEASPDGILALAPDGTILAANRKLLDMCGVQALEDRAEVGRWTGAALARRISDPKRFQARVRFLYENPGTGDVITLEGRTYRRTSAVLHDADRLEAGRVWFFRDVTAERNLQGRIDAMENVRRGQ